MHFRSIRKTANDISISDPIESDSDGGELTLMDTFADEDSMIEQLDRKLQAKKLRNAVEELRDPREKEIVILRYGLNGREPMAQREIAQKLGISRSYVSRIEKKALAQLKERLSDTEYSES